MMAQPSASVRILLPERTRLLQGQQVDLVFEVRNAAAVSGLKVIAGGVDLTSKFSAPVKTDLGLRSSTDWVMRANLQSFDTPGDIKLDVSLTAGSAAVSDSRTIQVREFIPPSVSAATSFSSSATPWAPPTATRPAWFPARSSMPTARTPSAKASSTTCSKWTRCRLAACR